MSKEIEKEYIEECVKHFEYLNKTFKYGYMKDGKIETDNWDDFDRCWKYRNVEQIKKDKCGICYDYSLVTFKEFETKRDRYTLIPIFFYARNDLNHDMPTHTVCFVKPYNVGHLLNQGSVISVISIESAWESYKGVIAYNSIDDGVMAYQRKLESENRVTKTMYLAKFYDPSDKKLFGLSQIEFEKYVIKNGIDLKDITSNPIASCLLFGRKM